MAVSLFLGNHQSISDSGILFPPWWSLSSIGGSGALWEVPPSPVTSFLLQHCNGVDWRQKLDSQRGAVIATELKNNSYKLARWTCCALLAGSEYLKLG